ncbi:hypothetical protein KCP76_17095 [Salmonella enterica subsp. enterica serovar Weltevreden]|nr:hypothetical protein KCP76_17095 [Salmonella enterica subsp. enterica serovar Weltevreden]
MMDGALVSLAILLPCCLFWTAVDVHRAARFMLQDLLGVVSPWLKRTSIFAAASEPACYGIVRAGGVFPPSGRGRSVGRY